MSSPRRPEHARQRERGPRVAALDVDVGGGRAAGQLERVRAVPVPDEVEVEGAIGGRVDVDAVASAAWVAAACRIAVGSVSAEAAGRAAAGGDEEHGGRDERDGKSRRVMRLRLARCA